MPDNNYDSFWSKELTGEKSNSKRRGWFKRGHYAWLARFAPRYFLTHHPARKYHLETAKLAKGYFCDLGCGIGNCAAIYAAYSHKDAVGIDISNEAINFANREKDRLELKNVRYIISQITQTQFADNTFDSAYLGQVLEHVADEHTVLNEARRILKPGGRLIVTVPDGDKLPSPYHVRTYNRHTVELLLGPYARDWLKFYYFDIKRIAVTLEIKK